MAHLNAAQKLTLKADIIAKQAVGQPFFGITDDQVIASWYSATATPAFIVWKSTVSINETGKKYNGSEWATMTSANHTRLQTIAQWLPAGYSPGLQDIRDMFNDVWSGKTLTLAALLALWKRNARELEKLFAVGTGNDALPATLVVEGSIGAQEISDVISGL